MAKTTAKTTTPTTAKGKKGVGWRYCEKCDTSTKGPKSATCGKCGEPFPVKAKAKGKRGRNKAGAGATAMGDTLTAAVSLVRSAGGFDKAKDILNALESVKGL
jgi:hypothetical protein